MTNRARPDRYLSVSELSDPEQDIAPLSDVLAGSIGLKNINRLSQVSKYM